jgi:hypothetical protein
MHYNQVEPKFKSIKCWTDNCAGQCKCRQNFLKVAMMPKDHPGIETERHSFAQKNQFKGAWDAAGKVVKSGFKRRKLEDE